MVILAIVCTVVVLTSTVMAADGLSLSTHWTRSMNRFLKSPSTSLATATPSLSSAARFRPGGSRTGPPRGPVATTTTSTTSTTSTTETTTTVPATGGTGSEITSWRGAGLVDLPAACSDIKTLGLSWYYNWGTTTPCPDVGVPFVPMQWGDWCPGSSTCTALPSTLGANGNKYLLTFNEPNNSSQSNMSVARALQLWPALEATGLQLSSPAVTGDASGSAWLASFMAGARQQGLRVDFLALHWYGDCSNPQNLINYLAGMESTYGLPVWLTEFSCYGDSLAVNTSFFQQVAPELAALPYLQRFAWFTNRPYPGGYEYTSLLTSAGVLTTTGAAYVAVPSAMTSSRQLVPWTSG